ncbi:MAG: LptF/LptG family permease, partial [Verrucomicrobiia bacterium]
MKILAKYITRQAVITLFFTVGVFTFVLLLARILRQLSEMLLNQKVGLEVVGYFLLLMTPTILSFSLPMAMLATTLLIFGRMSADNEITAMRANGMSLGQVMAPVILLAELTSVCCLYINANLAPWCKFEFKTMFVRLGAER